MRTAFFLVLLLATLVVAGMAFETFFIRLYLLGEVRLYDLFLAIFEVSGAAWCLYEIHIGGKK